MLPKMKEDPARVRVDLVHAFGFMLQMVASGHRWSKPLTRVEKLHGMFPRQYPSRWDDRSVEVPNDNRPYNDSAVWLADALNRYLRETGDTGILSEHVPTVTLTLPECPERSGLVDGGHRQSVAEALVALFEAYGRHADDSPYGLVQILYGDWCDPVDLFGTSIVGDAATRGMGRGVQVRLSAHVFCALVETIDTLESPRVAAALPASVVGAVPGLKAFARRLRRKAMQVAWEGGRNAGFVAAIHELRTDGSRPDYRKGEAGYTLGSMRGTDFDGRRRRELTVQAYGMRMLGTERPWLASVPDAARKTAAILRTCDRRLYSPQLGLRLFDPPIANDPTARRLVGRMGVLPTGCAENGEYHHGQMMMHRYRALSPDGADAAWSQFKPMVSALRDESLAGPFDMPATSYASDPADPHFGKGMYFGLSGSTDWIIDYLQDLVGLELALHDDRKPDVRVCPRLPRELGGKAVLRRVLHVALTDGSYRRIPAVIELKSAAKHGRPSILINGATAKAAEVESLAGVDRLHIEIVRPVAANHSRRHAASASAGGAMW
jgi:cellobiose phosphorylase